LGRQLNHQLAHQFGGMSLPLYEYKCLKCDRHTDKIEPVAGPHLKKCPHCGGKVESVITAPAIKFKGSGWYVNDYAAKTPSGESKKTDGSSSDSKDSKEPSSKDSSKDSGKDSASKDSKDSSEGSAKKTASEESSSPKDSKDKKSSSKKD
jgi:putative FmdB family regulatory protein